MNEPGRLGDFVTIKMHLQMPVVHVSE